MNQYRVFLQVSLMLVSVNAFTQNNNICSHVNTMIENIQSVLINDYVLPKSGSKGAEHLGHIEIELLNQRCRKNSAIEFAQYLESEIRQSTGDNHIVVEYLDQNAETVEDNWIEQWKANGAKVNFGIDSVKILQGNIGVIKISSFYTYELIKKKLEAAFLLLEHTEGLIIDLRDNGGGDIETEMLITNTFFDNAYTNPLVLVNNAGEITLPELKHQAEWERIGSQKPLAVLINRKTFSAPESLAYALQAEGRALIVGQTSGGGANPLDKAIKLNDYFQIWVPQIRPISLKTKTNWEGVGVIPDILTEDGKAEQKAYDYLLNLK